MEYKANLKRLKRSPAGITTGIAIIPLIFVRIYLEHDTLIQWFYSAFYLTIDVILLFDAYGYTFNRAAIDMDDQQITIRSGLLSKKQTVFWKDILSIDIYRKRILFHLRNDKNTSIYTIRIPDEHLEHIKELLKETSKTKDIKVTDKTLKQADGRKRE